MAVGGERKAETRIRVAVSADGLEKIRAEVVEKLGHRGANPDEADKALNDVLSSLEAAGFITLPKQEGVKLP